MDSTFTFRKRAFTLIELLVISSATVLLVAVAMPGILQARQRAREENCKNNLKQLGLAMHNYHDVYNSFPPAWCARHTNADSQSWYGWQCALLPYIEQANLYSQINFHTPEWTTLPPKLQVQGRGKSTEAEIPRMEIAFYLCPQDSTGGTNPFCDGYGTSNYSGNFGSELLPRWYESGSEQFWPGGVPTPTKGNGIMSVNSKIGIRDITDGTSNTVMISERSALSGAGLWVGVRSNRHENDVMTDMNHLSGLNKSFAGFSGRHDGKVNMCICDGSVRLVNEEIDSSLEGGVLQALGTRAGGEVLGEF